jgi:hypothetical protein
MKNQVSSVSFNIALFTKALFTIRTPKRKAFYFYSSFTFDVQVVPNALFTLSNNQQN